MQVSNTDAKEQELIRLTEEHQTLKARLRELDKHRILTTAEQVERTQLKKMKLLTKERILRLQHN